MQFRRRGLVKAAGAAFAFGQAGFGARLLGQTLPGEGFGTPLGLSPFTAGVYRARRADLMARIKTGVAVVFGADRPASSGSTEVPFAQDGNFAWLTGITDEPGAILVLAPTERTIREWLLLPSRDVEGERWSSERLPLGSLIEERTGIQRVYRTSSLGGVVSSLAERSRDLHYLGPIVSADAPVPRELELYGKVAGRVPGASIKDDSALMPSLRVVKEPRELAVMAKAMDATRAGHLAAMKAVRPGMTERQLKFILENAFVAAGGTGLAYGSIVASGRNAASLHYVDASGTIGANDLILIDAAASVNGYACDVTRTFPASGRFTAEQRQLYELVLTAQNAAVAKLKAGAYYEDISEAARGVFRKAGLIDQFTHGLGHFVGLDVHDIGDTSKPLPAGSVITMEPGIYNQAGNYGIRIEDLYLVTATGAERLSTGIPRTVDEIESFMAR